MQKQIAQKRIQVKAVQKPRRSLVSCRPQDHPYSRAQGIIGNHGVLGRYGTEIVQAKLNVGSPGDRYEQEADKVTKQIMQKSGSDMQIGPANEALRFKRDPTHTPYALAELESRIRSLHGKGQPLSESIRNFFEPRFGHGLSSIRVHRDSKSSDSADAVNARAFTTGNHIVFGAGEYKPDTVSGKRLLAHELAHTVQQNGMALHGYSYNFIQREQAEPEAEGSGDRFEALISRGPEILRQLNPPDDLGLYCRNNCPATAAAVYHYLRTGQIEAAHCDEIYCTGEYNWVNTTWSQIYPIASLPVALGHASSHGQFVVIEGNRSSPPPAGLTPDHYFVVVNIQGSQYVVDAFDSGLITGDVNQYVQNNQFLTYRYVTGSYFGVEPVCHFQP